MSKHEVNEQLLACIPRLRRYARALIGDKARADDLVQDTMERAWKHLDSWRTDGDMRAWLFGIMHNLHVDHLRRQQVLVEEWDDEIVSERPSAVTDPLVLRDLDTALRLLPAGQREVLLMVGLEEMSYDDVALALGVPLGTVMSRLSRARQKLRALMEGQPYVALKVVK